jgi:chloramphenicol 3-O phosphotransferase
MAEPGWIVILNGAPRSGKSSIVDVIQESFDGPWMNLGVDVYSRLVTPRRLRPGIGLRPGGERPEIEVLIPAMYAAMYASVAAHSREGLNVVVDVGHHDAYSKPLHLLSDAARRLEGLPALLVGVRCSFDAIMRRRETAQPEREGQYVVRDADGTIPDPVVRWQREVHIPGIYDLEVDTDVMSPVVCAELIRRRLEDGPPPTALSQLASRA